VELDEVQILMMNSALHLPHDSLWSVRVTHKVEVLEEVRLLRALSRLLYHNLLCRWRWRDLFRFLLSLGSLG
jgi:hypothetical protein